MNTRFSSKYKENKNRAFNAGSDARILGLGLDRCPYLVGSLQNQYWRLGWLHCDANWGSSARWGTQYRWPVRELPKAC